MRGTGLVALSAVTLSIVSALGIAGWVGGRPGWLGDNISGGILLVALLGLAALKRLRRGSGTLYDPAIAHTLLGVLNRMDFSKLLLQKGTDPFSALKPGPDQENDPEAVQSPLRSDPEPVH